VRIPVPVRGHCVVLAASLDGKTLPLLFAPAPAPSSKRLA